MTYKSDIEKLRKELTEKERQQSLLEKNCKHKWGDTKYEPEEYQKARFSHYEGNGSDPNPIYNYYSATKDRWSRECELCDKKQYTYNKAPVKYEPKF